MGNNIGDDITRESLMPETRQNGGGKKKLIILTVAVLGVIGIAMYVMRGHNDPLSAAEIGDGMANSALTAAKAAILPAQNISPEQQKIPGAKSVPGLLAADSDIMARVDEIVTGSKVNTEAITAVKGQLDEVRSTVQSSASKDQVAALESKVGEVSVAVADLVKYEKNRLAQQRAVNKAAPTLPFSVVAVDLWEERPYVALTFDGHTEMVPVGDRRATWLVERIEYQAGRVTFRNEQGQEVVKTVLR